MSLRKIAASVTAVTVAVVGLHVSAGAASSTFTVSDTTIEVGQTVTVTLTTPCVNPTGEPYGNILQSKVGTPGVLDNQETKRAEFIKGDTGVFTFPGPGTYTLTRFCDGVGQLDQVTITVRSPSTTTTTLAPTTTAAPASTTTTTAAPASTTTTAAPGATTTTTAAVRATTTTVATAVQGVSTTVGSSSGQATGATRVQAGVSYTG